MEGIQVLKRPYKQANEDESSSSSVSDQVITSGSNSPASSTSNHGTPTKMKKLVEPWDVPIHSETKKLLFMPVDINGKNHMKKLNEYSQQTKLNNLKRIDIDFSEIIEKSNELQDEQISAILNRIFLASADSLKEINLMNPIGYIPGLVFPVMKNVVSLQLSFSCWGSDATNVTDYLRNGKIFPKGFKFTVFPKLEEVIISLEAEGSRPQNCAPFDCWKKNLQSCGIARSVRKIEYSDECDFSTKHLKVAFPKAVWANNSSFEEE